MKAVFCAECGTKLSLDEIALNQRLLGMHIGSFYCLGCLARRMGTPTERLQNMIVRYKERGCAYFTRLMEVSPDEKKNDNM